MDTRERAFYSLWGKIRRPEQGCWTWRSKALGVAGGYHQVRIGYHPETGTPITQVASRFVFEMMWGGPLPAGMEVAHLCDRPACVKPSHLILATRTQNEMMKDPRRRVDNRVRTIPVPPQAVVPAVYSTEPPQAPEPRYKQHAGYVPYVPRE